MSETIAEAAEDDEALESVVDADAVDAVEALDDELDDSSAASRLVRSASSVDSRLLALDELSVELDDELESLVPDTPGGAPGGGPPGGGPPTPPGPPDEPALAELSLLSELTPPLVNCDRKTSTAADNPTEADESADDDETLVDALDDEEAVALDWSETLF